MDQALKTMIENIPEKTGKSLEDWKIILKGKSFSKHTEAVRFLKSEFNLTHGYANTIVSLSKEEKNEPVDLLAEQYKGKENLLLIYNAIADFVSTLGSDISIVPKKTSISIRRKTQFVLVVPATKKRIDLGLKIKDKDITERLENSGPFGTMCTHRVRISSADELDDELKSWIKEAYEKAI